MCIVNSRKVKPRIIGLTGNIACGKSLAAKILSASELQTPERRIAVIDADRVSQELTDKPGPVRDAIVRAFGGFDRDHIRQKVFNNEVERKKLEAILHPAIRAASQEKFEALFKQGFQIVVYEASLLFEAGRATDFDGVLLITCDANVQRSRLKIRNPTLDDALVEKMISAQWPQEKKRQIATWTIENNGTEEELKQKLSKWIESL